MSLRREIETSPETLSDMDAAAALGWREGDHLLTLGDFDGAVYLLGYVVEMRLKLAAFRRLNARPNDMVNTLRLTVSKWMHANAPNVVPESGHSLLYWVTFLQLNRTSMTTSYTPILLKEIRRHVLGSVYQEWKVDMRYRDTKRSYENAWQIWVAAWWMEEHWLIL